MKSRLDHPVNVDAEKAEGVFHARPTRAKRRKFKRAESDLSLCECRREEQNSMELFNFVA